MERKEGTSQEGRKHEQTPETGVSIVGLGLQGAQCNWDQASWAQAGRELSLPKAPSSRVTPKAEGRREN